MENEGLLPNLELTEEERKELEKYGLSYGNPVPEEKHNVHTFLNKIATSEDTTKTGFLIEDEVGNVRHPTRAYKNAALIAKDIMNNENLFDYFKKKSEIITSTSLSRSGFLAKLAIVQEKRIADVTPQKKENKGWFKKKDDNTPQVGAI